MENIAKDYVGHFKQIQSNFDAQFLPICTKVNNRVSKSTAQHKATIEQESSIVKVITDI